MLLGYRFCRRLYQVPALYVLRNERLLICPGLLAVLWQEKRGSSLHHCPGWSFFRTQSSRECVSWLIVAGYGFYFALDVSRSGVIGYLLLKTGKFCVEVAFGLGIFFVLAATMM